MSCVLYEGDNGYCAMVAEVDVDQDDRHASPCQRFVVAQDCGPDLESRRHEEPDRRRRAAGHEPRARRRSHVGRRRRSRRSTGAPIHSLSLGGDVPVIESVLINRPTRSDRRRRNRDHGRRRRDRQRDLRRDRRAASRSAVHARARQSGARGSWLTPRHVHRRRSGRL